MKEMSAKEIKEQHPEEWKLLQTRIRIKNKPVLGKKIIDGLRKEAEGLYRTTLQLHSTATRPFVTICEILWDEDWAPIFNQIIAIKPRSGASTEEKRLVSWFGRNLNQETYDELYNAVVKHPHMRARAKEILAFQKKMDALARDYDFDYDDIGHF
jgi:hypothetical protein